MSFFSDSLIKKETFWFEQLPLSCYQASGIVVNGRRIKSLVFTTDLAIIRNCDADAVFAVYPFTPQSAISHALINGSYIPVFCGCGGGTTKGLRTLSLAQDAEGQGAMGIVLNAPISDLNLLAVTKVVDIPVIITVVSEEVFIEGTKIASTPASTNAEARSIVSTVTPTPAATRKRPFSSLHAIGLSFAFVMSLYVIKPTKWLSLSTTGSFSILFSCNICAAAVRSVC